MKSKAVLIRSHGGPEVLELADVDVKDPGPDEVRIRQHAIGDLRRGHREPAGWYPVRSDARNRA